MLSIILLLLPFNHLKRTNQCMDVFILFPLPVNVCINVSVNLLRASSAAPAKHIINPGPIFSRLSPHVPLFNNCPLRRNSMTINGLLHLFLLRSQTLIASKVPICSSAEIGFIVGIGLECGSNCFCVWVYGLWRCGHTHRYHRNIECIY